MRIGTGERYYSQAQERNSMRIKVWAKTNIVGSKSCHEFDIDEEEWNNMSDDERDDFCQEKLWNLIDWGYEEAPTKE